MYPIFIVKGPLGSFKVEAADYNEALEVYFLKTNAPIETVIRFHTDGLDYTQQDAYWYDKKDELCYFVAKETT